MSRATEMFLSLPKISWLICRCQIVKSVLCCEILEQQKQWIKPITYPSFRHQTMGSKGNECVFLETPNDHVICSSPSYRPPRPHFTVQIALAMNLICDNYPQTSKQDDKISYYTRGYLIDNTIDIPKMIHHKCHDICLFQWWQSQADAAEPWT